MVANMPSDEDIQKQATEAPKSPNLIGSIKIKTKNLEAASNEIAELFIKSIEDTAKNLRCDHRE